MRSSRLFRLSPIWLVLGVLAGLLVTMIVLSSTVLSAAPVALTVVPGAIEGVLYEPDGTTVVAGGWIDIHDAQGQPWMGTDTDAGGNFAIANLPPGDYVLNAHPPEGCDFVSSLPVEVNVSSGQWSEAELFLTEVRISGWVQDSETGGRIEGAWVMAHDDEWTVERWSTTNVNGEYKIGGVQVGVTYTLEAFPPPESAYVQLPIHYTAVPTATFVVLEMHVPPTNVVGIVHDPTGAAVAGAGVVVFHDEFWAETAADELGGFLFQVLPPGEFWLHAAPPWGLQGLIASDPITLTITSTEHSLVDVGVITLPHAYKTVRGQVLFEGTTNGVADAMPTAHRLDGPGYADTPADASGAFTMSLSGGEWHVAVEPLNPGAEWLFPGPPAWIVFEQNTTAQTETVSLEVIPTNARVTGRVVCPGGDPCVDDDPPPGAIQMEVRHDHIGNGADLDAEYRFTIPIPDGWYELLAHVDDPMLQGPEPMPVFVGPDKTADVGDIQLLLKDAQITGQVRDQFGIGVEGVFVTGRQPEGCGWGQAETDASGYYTMAVIGGDWFVEPDPGPELPYVFRHEPQSVRVVPGGSMTGVDFSLTNADARVLGVAVDANTAERIWGLDGWAFAQLHVAGSDPDFFSGSPVSDGGFELKLAGGEEYHIGVELPPHAPYVSGSSDLVSIDPGAVVTLAVPLEPKDAAIAGRLIDASTGLTPTLPIWAEVFGHDEGDHWVSISVDPDTGMYELGVISGTWHLRTWADLDAGYVAAPTPAVVAVVSGQAVNQDFQVWPISARITGTLWQPSGVPLTSTFVFAEGNSPHVGYFEASVETDQQGLFDLSVPEGDYVVGAALPGDELAARGWLNPPPVDVSATVTAPVTGLEIRFRELDGLITGTVSFASGGTTITPTHTAYVWGWAESGEWAETEAQVVDGTRTFTYALRVVSDTVWHVGAVYEDWDNGQYYESAEEVVSVTPSSSQVTQDLTLAGPYSLPQPIIVSFDGTQMQTIVFPGGMELSIPPGALVVSGTVTLFIFPTQEMRPEAGQEVIGVGYEIWAVDQNGQEITQFNKNVVMTFYYPSDAALAAQGISEHKLVPVYYSTLLGHWTLADSYVVDTANNQITCQMRHFTKFGVSSTEAKEHYLYLPLILKQSS